MVRRTLQDTYGKDHEDNYELGFDPSPSGSISKHQLLTTMQYYSSGIDFKTNEGFIAYKEDYVAYSNAYFFTILTMSPLRRPQLLASSVSMCISTLKSSP